LRQRKEDIPILANHFLKELAASSGRPEVGLTRGALEKLMNHHWPGNVRELKNCITRGLAFADSDVLYAEDLIFDDATGLGHGDAGLEPRSYVIPVQEGGSGATAMPASSPQSDGSAGPAPLYGGASGNGIAPGASFAGVGQDAEDVPPPPPPTLAPRLAGAEEGAADKALGQHGGHRQQIALRLARERGSFSRLDYQQAVGGEISQRTAQYDLQTLVKNGRLRKVGKGPATQYFYAES